MWIILGLSLSPERARESRQNYVIYMMSRLDHLVWVSSGEPCGKKSVQCDSLSGEGGTVALILCNVRDRVHGCLGLWAVVPRGDGCSGA